MKRLTLTAALVACALCFGYAAQRSSKYDIARNLQTFSSIYKILMTDYVDTLDADAAAKVAIDEMLLGIDPYTQYIPTEEIDEFHTISSGEFSGIGATIRQLPSGETMIAEPTKGSPADIAGLRAADVIIAIDGDTVTTIGMPNVRKRLLGHAGTPIELTVRRPYAADSILTFTFNRAKIDVPTMPYYGVVRDTLGYINLSTFNVKSAPEVRRAVKELLADKRVKALALDLRGNGGGLLESAIDIVSLFVDKGTEVLRTRGREASDERIYRANTKPIDTRIPLIVLIDENSASSAEVTAGALQDLDRAVIVGRRSFGKGLVQSTRQLPDGALLKLTTARYYIPSGRLIQALDYSHRNADGSATAVADSIAAIHYTAAGRPVRGGGGITPDVEVPQTKINMLIYNLYADDWIFNFVTRYAAEHPTIAVPDDFVVTDEIYDEFKASLDPERVQTDKVCDNLISDLEKAAELSGYMDDSVRAQIDVLKQLLHPDLDRDLDIHRRLISTYITDEMMRRYYYLDGSIRASLLTDPVIDAAIDVIATPGRYQSILASPK